MASPSPFSFMQLANLEHIEAMYALYQENPESVETSWRYFFEVIEFGTFADRFEKGKKDEGNLRIFQLIDAYRRFGHLSAKSNPLLVGDPPLAKELQLATWGLEESDLQKSFSTGGLL